MSVFKTNGRKLMAGLLAISTLGAAMTLNTGAAEAYWRGGGWRGGWGPGIGLGVVGGLAAGALVAGAARPYYYDGPGYYEGGCRLVRRPVTLDDGSYRMARVRVCN
jgi:hypothetical protein